MLLARATDRRDACPTDKLLCLPSALSEDLADEFVGGFYLGIGLGLVGLGLQPVNLRCNFPELGRHLLLIGFLGLRGCSLLSRLLTTSRL